MNNNISSHIPWIEKYRPQSINDLCIDFNMFNKINRIIQNKDMPNVIITGLPGIGKTSTILCIAKALLGSHYQQGILELNASDDRGIKAVKDSIIYFCKKKIDSIINDPATSNHKIILLDEADNMTRKAQQLINTLMEKYHHTTRFALTCNDSSKIIEAIQSRCIIFRYKSLSPSDVSKRLHFICSHENIKFSSKGIDALVKISQGDLRSAINNLQLVFNGFELVNSKNVYKLCDKPNPLIIKKIFIACFNNNIFTALSLLNNLRNNGYSSSDIIISMKNFFKFNTIDSIPYSIIIQYLSEISKTAITISQGIDSRLQTSGCICKLCLIR